MRVEDKWLPLSELQRLDARLCAWGRGQAALRLRIGELGEALGSSQGHRKLGFSKIGDYALQRCGKSGSWLGQCRSVARTVSSLPTMRAALCAGELSFSMAVEIAPKTTPQTEDAVMARARGATVRQMKAFFAEAAAPKKAHDIVQTEPQMWGSWDEWDLIGECDEEAKYVKKQQWPPGIEPPEPPSCTASVSPDSIEQQMADAVGDEAKI